MTCDSAPETTPHSGRTSPKTKVRIGEGHPGKAKISHRPHFLIEGRGDQSESWVKHSRSALVNYHDFGHFGVSRWPIVYVIVCHDQTGTSGKFSPNDETLASAVFGSYRVSNSNILDLRLTYL